MAWLNSNKVIHELEKVGNFYYLLNALLGAYNRRTDVMERQVKLDERVQSVIHKLDTAGEKLQDAIDKTS